jgi:hypothetical protein
MYISFYFSCVCCALNQSGTTLDLRLVFAGLSKESGFLKVKKQNKMEKLIGLS